MEDYKLRMVNEYRELKEKYDKLHRMLVKYDAGKLDFIPACPIDLLRKQASCMGQYLYILETRAVIEGVNLNAEEEKKEKKEPDEKSVELKQILFNDTAEYKLPIYTSLIVCAGLMDEYQEWLKEHGYK